MCRYVLVEPTPHDDSSAQLRSLLASQLTRTLAYERILTRSVSNRHREIVYRIVELLWLPDGTPNPFASQAASSRSSITAGIAQFFTTRRQPELSPETQRILQERAILERERLALERNVASHQQTAADLERRIRRQRLEEREFSLRIEVVQSDNSPSDSAGLPGPETSPQDEQRDANEA